MANQTKPKRIAAAVHKTAVCTIGLHPTDKATGRVTCLCGDYALRQCCDAGYPPLTGYGPCRTHKCGPRVGCRCPLPDDSDKRAKPQ